MKMTLVCMKMKLHAELIQVFAPKTRFETEAQENSEMAYLMQCFFVVYH